MGACIPLPCDEELREELRGNQEGGEQFRILKPNGTLLAKKVMYEATKTQRDAVGPTEISKRSASTHRVSSLHLFRKSTHPFLLDS